MIVNYTYQPELTANCCKTVPAGCGEAVKRRIYRHTGGGVYVNANPRKKPEYHQARPQRRRAGHPVEGCREIAIAAGLCYAGLSDASFARRPSTRPARGCTQHARSSCLCSRSSPSVPSTPPPSPSQRPSPTPTPTRTIPTAKSALSCRPRCPRPGARHCRPHRTTTVRRSGRGNGHIGWRMHGR